MFGCSDVRRQKSGERILELRAPVPVPRQVQALGRMKHYRADIIRLQQRGEFSLADRGATAERTPLGIRVGREKLHEFGRRDLGAIGEDLLQSRQQPDPCTRLGVLP